jgi:hypothetical protein
MFILIPTPSSSTTCTPENFLNISFAESGAISLRSFLDREAVEPGMLPIILLGLLFLKIIDPSS